MKLYRSAGSKLRNAKNGSSVALGCFDGVHIGHAKIISEAVGIAKNKGLCSVIWSFEMPPKSILKNEKGILITPLNEKKRLIRALGADYLVSVPFNEKIASLTPREFFESILIEKLNAKHIVCGYNYRFGRGGSGDAELLRSLCDERGISLTVIREVKINEKTVSSSAIRALLKDGMLKDAEKMLGRRYYIRAKVSDGQHLGRSLGFPTVNQALNAESSPLRKGVYLTQTKINGQIKYGVTNVGNRPTVTENSLVCETHILDFNGSLYGKTLKVEFIEFIRDERKFTSLDDLKKQIEADVKTARNRCGGRS